MSHPHPTFVVLEPSCPVCLEAPSLAGGRKEKSEKFLLLSPAVLVPLPLFSPRQSCRLGVDLLLAQELQSRHSGRSGLQLQRSLSAAAAFANAAAAALRCNLFDSRTKTQPFFSFWSRGQNEKARQKLSSLQKFKLPGS